ncbi:TIGR00730 family Rossman fold protein [Streptomyces sp. NBC_00859]|uniref:LOG family protein n=1 Tax=Streptomyces sp. NBC_00859 TaxID=2903682 RepID=UPI0038637287|nr:TIGR00730 family Rossman fold protein [Streptomyces sp. NBC_00859]
MALPPSGARRVGVLCGSRGGRTPLYVESATALGDALGRRGADLVYGAGGSGVMGAVSQAAHRAGAKVTGVIPHALHERERAVEACGEIFVVPSMHERKALIYRLSDAFLVLPGGFGTLDELMEVATWNQLGYHQKPVVLVNVREFFQPLISMLDRMEEEGFFTARERSIVRVADGTDAALDMLGLPRPAPTARMVPA